MTTISSTSRIGFVGAGKVGGALAVALSRKGYRVVAAASRTFSSAQALAGRVQECRTYATAQEAADACELVFVTTSDDAIGQVTSAIDWREGQAVVHCSGAASLDVLEHAREQGAATGALHPLQAFASVESALEKIPGSTFAIEGEGEMRALLEKMALDMGGKPIYLRGEDKALYHASVVLLGGVLLSFVPAVADIWGHFGIDRARALEGLLPIIEGDIAAIRALGIPEGITGPHSRGDTGTVRKHLTALRAAAPEMLPAYCHMALAGLAFSAEKGRLPPDRVSEIRRLLESFARGGDG